MFSTLSCGQLLRPPSQFLLPDRCVTPTDSKHFLPEELTGARNVLQVRGGMSIAVAFGMIEVFDEGRTSDPKSGEAATFPSRNS